MILTSNAINRTRLLEERLSLNTKNVESADSSSNADLFSAWKTIPTTSLFDTSDLKARVYGVPLELIESATSNNSTSSEVDDVSGWYSRFTKAFASTLESKAHNYDLPEKIGFLNLVRPLIIYYLEKLESDLHNVHIREIAISRKTALESFKTELLARLGMMIHRTMILEINVSRLREAHDSPTSEEGFYNFCEQLLGADRRAEIFEEYPVLARRIIHSCDNWRKNSIRLFTRLNNDHERITETFLHTKSTITSISVEAGDVHNEGQSVRILEYECGTRIVYKPRGMRVETEFQELLRNLSRDAQTLEFRPIKILECDNYGYAEFVEHKTCDTETDIERYYTRLGGLMALLYMLDATDFHHENIIACSDHPILIDLESLFHNREPVNTKDDVYLNPSMKLMKDSVLRLGLLPTKIWAKDYEYALDISGISSPEGQKTTVDVNTIEGRGTDQIRIAQSPGVLGSSKNQPFEGTRPITEFIPFIVEGYNQIYKIFLAHHEEYFGENGHLSRFENVRLRVILRPTRRYSVLLRESFHPNVLRDAMEFDILSDTLFLETHFQPWLSELVIGEKRDIFYGDIPYYETTNNSVDLILKAGIIKESFFKNSGYHNALASTNKLSEEDRIRQEWFIRASIATSKEGLDSTHWPRYKVSDAQNLGKHVSYNKLASEAASRLKTLAMQDERFISWMGMTLVREKFWTLSPIDLNIYTGIGGVMLFFATIRDQLGASEYDDIVSKCDHTISDAIREQPESIQTIGAFSGWAGMTYLYCRMFQLTKNPHYRDKMKGFAGRIMDYLEYDKTNDIMSGSAGAIIVLCNIRRALSTNEFDGIISSLAEKLNSNAIVFNGRKNWLTVNDTHPIGGFSHGASGIAVALLKLYEFTNDDQYLLDAQMLFDFERDLYDPERKNWADIREVSLSSGNAPFMMAWCHGAPGIGLSRLMASRIYSSEMVEEDLNIAIATTSSSFGTNHSLCHGDLGNYDLLLSAVTEQYGNVKSANVKLIGSIIVESMKRVGMLTGVPLGVEVTPTS